jgi:hypothetical protein
MQLGHAVKDVHRIAYNRTKFLAERTGMMQTWADYLDWLRTGEPMAEADNVHQIKRTGLSSLLGVHEIGTTPI